MATTKTAEAAVREYLRFVDDPTQLVDRRTIEKLEKRIAAATDPLDRLVAIAEHERALHPAEAPYRDAFIAHAKTWAAAHNVSASAFERMGVGTDVLAAAGMMPAHSRNRRLPRKSASGTSVPVEDIKNVARKLPGQFSGADVARAAGGSPMTVRKALNQLVAEGVIRRLGPAPDWSRQGRAPILYQRV
jgi:hypothetical protein